jgi:E3 ubiquitin-protein ligase HUWE1
VHLASEEAVKSTIFLYEPDLITQLAGLLPSYDELATTAVIALDACSHHEGKMSEIMTALSANANHGTLMTLFRGIVVRIETVSDTLVDSMYAFIAHILNSNGHINMLVGAGLMPILLDMLSIKSARRDNVSYGSNLKLMVVHSPSHWTYRQPDVWKPSDGPRFK